MDVPGRKKKGLCQTRHGDGSFRPNRPLPPGYSPRAHEPQCEPKMQLSPRWQRSAGVYEWVPGLTSYESTSEAHYGQMDGYVRPGAAMRHEHSPRYNCGKAAELMFGVPAADRAPPRARPPPPLSVAFPARSPRSDPTPPAVDANLPLSGRKHATARLQALERALHEERRVTSRTRALLESELRWVPFDPRSYHDPDGQPFRKA